MSSNPQRLFFTVVFRSIDPSRVGGAARLVNHSCEPNLCKKMVYVDHEDTNYPRVGFFSVRTIYREFAFTACIRAHSVLIRSW